MYDDLLGPRKKPEKNIKNRLGKRGINLTNMRSQKINFNCDHRTVSGRLYPKHIMDKALYKALRKNFFIVDGTPNDPTTVNIANVIGIVKSYAISNNGEIWFSIKYIDNAHAKKYGDMEISACCIGNVDKDLVIREGLIVTQLYVIT